MKRWLFGWLQVEIGSLQVREFHLPYHQVEIPISGNANCTKSPELNTWENDKNTFRPDINVKTLIITQNAPQYLKTYATFSWKSPKNEFSYKKFRKWSKVINWLKKRLISDQKWSFHELKFGKFLKIEGLEISVKSDRAVKSEKFFNPGWSWPTLSEFLWFPSCYQPQTKLKVSQFIRFFFDCGHVVYIKSSCVSPLTDLYISIPSSRSRMETASLILCLARASNSCSNQLIKMTSYFLDSYSKHSTGGHASYHTCL